MTSLSAIRPAGAAVFLSALVLFALPAHAQLGGLIKKKINQAAAKDPAQQPANAPVVFDSVTLEITQERIAKLTAAKRAVRTFAESPNGPAAYEKRIEALDARQAAIYEKQVDNINGLEAKQGDYGRCLDSAFVEIHDRKEAASNPLSDPALMRRMMEMGQAMALAQQRGDTAAVRKIVEALEKMKAPTKADSLAAQKACGPAPSPSAIIKQWLDLKAQLDTLGRQRAAAEDSIPKLEQRISGMSPRQSAVFCERIKVYVQQLKEKKKRTGFSDDEVKRLANLEQAIKDLEALCP